MIDYFENSKLELLNSFAAVFDDKVLLHAYKKVPLEVSIIQDVYVARSRKIRFNLFFFLLALFLETLYFTNNFKLLWLDMFFLVVGVFSFLGFYFLKVFDYSFVLVKTNNEVMRLKVKKELVSDVKQVVRLLKKKLRINIKLHTVNNEKNGI